MSTNDGSNAAPKSSGRYVPPHMRNRPSSETKATEDQDTRRENAGRDVRNDTRGPSQGRGDRDGWADSGPAQGRSAWDSPPQEGQQPTNQGAEAKRTSPPPPQNSRFDCLKEEPAQRYDDRGERGASQDRGYDRGGERNFQADRPNRDRSGDRNFQADQRDQRGGAAGGGGDGGRFASLDHRQDNRQGGFGDRGQERRGYGDRDRDDGGDRDGLRPPKGRGKSSSGQAGGQGFSSNSGDVRAMQNNYSAPGGELTWRNRRDGRRNSPWDEPNEIEVFGEPKEKPKSGINFDEYDKIPVQMSGEDVDRIRNIERFSEAKLNEQLQENIRRCGYDRPTPIQKYSIPIVTGGRDLMACAQTGSGKTAAFLLPTFQSMLTVGPPVLPSNVDSRTARMPMPIALVMAPTRELASQIAEEGKKFSYKTGIKVCVVYGGADMREQRREVMCGVDVLVATPGRLTDMKERGIISLGLCRFLMLDEADRMLDMGFEPQVRDIVMNMDMGKYEAIDRQSLMFSATFPKEVQMLAQDFLYDYVFLTVGRVGSTNEFIEQKLVYADDEDKMKQLMRMIKESDAPGEKNLMLVFVETKRGADTLERELWQKSIRVTAIHGDRTQAEREEALLAFRRGENPVLVATDVAARGLDIPDVQLVINHDMPKNIDDYVHRIGRTGRAGRKGRAIAFINESCNRALLKELNGLLVEAKQERPLWFQEMITRSGAGGRFGGQQKTYDRFGGRDARQGMGQPRQEAARTWGNEEVVRTGRKVEAFRDKKEEVVERPVDGGWGNSGQDDAW